MGRKGKKKQGARRYSIEGKPKAYVIRDKLGRFAKWVSKKDSVPRDRATKAKKKVKPGYGHLGDLPKR